MIFPMSHRAAVLCLERRLILLFLGTKGICQHPFCHPQYWDLPPAPLQRLQDIPCLPGKSEKPLLLHRCCFSSAALQNEQPWEGGCKRPRREGSKS